MPGLDNQKLFAHIQQTQATLIIRVQHENRLADNATRLKLETTFTRAQGPHCAPPRLVGLPSISSKYPIRCGC
jgi:hypothetical protein